ncbi:hypothetical protein KIW84_076498 [Lathyrus oleraceus]|uniref:Uncharacterized protein n=1 Tax=Pisum sativum TaxID=3888 RepID=A0A9D4VYC7_PEA|nr:hypothetical protein KIW84_076498 [Pisum sativum]
MFISEVFKVSINDVVFRVRVVQETLGPSMKMVKKDSLILLDSKDSSESECSSWEEFAEKEEGPNLGFFAESVRMEQNEAQCVVFDELLKAQKEVAEEGCRKSSKKGSFNGDIASSRPNVELGVSLGFSGECFPSSSSNPSNSSSTPEFVVEFFPLPFDHSVALVSASNNSCGMEDVGQYVGNRDLSDHCPIWMKASKEDRGPKPFKFNNSWLNHPEFSLFLKKVWKYFKVEGRGDFVLKEKLRQLKLSLKR